MGDEKKNSESQENCNNKNWIELTTLIVSIVVMIVLVWQTCETRRSINNQIVYNTLSIRPWVDIKPIGNITIIDSSAITFHYKTINYGKMPAFEVETSYIISNCEIQEVNTKIPQATDSLYTYLFPEAKQFGTLTVNLRYFLKMGINASNISELLDKLKNERIFFYYIIRYKDADGNKYNFINETEIKNFKLINDKEISCDFYYIRTY